MAVRAGGAAKAAAGAARPDAIGCSGATRPRSAAPAARRGVALLALAAASSLAPVASAGAQVPDQGSTNVAPSTGATAFRRTAHAPPALEQQAGPHRTGVLNLGMSSFGLLSVLLVGGTCILMAFHRKADGATEPAARTSVSASLRKAVYTAFVLAAFMVVGPGLVLLNKHIMNMHNFRYPLVLSSGGVIASMLVSHAAVWSGFAHVSAESVAAVKGAQWFRVALPIGAARAATLAMGNAVYLYLGLGFIQMLKALAPSIVLAVMCALGVRRPTRAAVWFVFMIVAGTMLEVKGELEASLIGLALMMFSEFCEAVALVLTQRLLQDRKFSVMESMYIVSPPVVVCLSLAALGMEVPRMVKSGDWRIVVDNSADFAGAAGLGLAVNWVTMMLIQATSSLFTKILNTVRCICLVGLGVAVYGEVVSPLEITGYVIALSGFAGYNYVQMFPDAASTIEHNVDKCICKNISSPPPSPCLGAGAADCCEDEAMPLRDGERSRRPSMSEGLEEGDAPPKVAEILG